MKVVADERRRVILPEAVHAGDIFDLEESSDGGFVLTKLEDPTRSSAKLIQRGQLFLLSSSKTITWDQTRKAMDEFP
jgi:hypothetical protein